MPPHAIVVIIFQQVDFMNRHSRQMALYNARGSFAGLLIALSSAWGCRLSLNMQIARNSSGVSVLRSDIKKQSSLLVIY